MANCISANTPADPIAILFFRDSNFHDSVVSVYKKGKIIIHINPILETFKPNLLQVKACPNSCNDLDIASAKNKYIAPSKDKARSTYDKKECHCCNTNITPNKSNAKFI